MTSLQKISESNLPTEFGDFRLLVYQADEKEPVVLVFGDITNQDSVLARVHSECLTGEVFHSVRCDCNAQKDQAMAAISKARAGVFIYLRQEGRGIGLGNKVKAYDLQDRGADTVEANEQLDLPVDNRDYSVAAEILKDLGVKKMRLLTNNPKKVTNLEENGIEVVERVGLEIPATKENEGYLKAKKEKLGHFLGEKNK